jgi:3-methylcrotonyl-CoA carboxylase alpha subunit
MFSKILIANRGEIALRVIRTAKQLEIRTVAIYSKSDSNALHVRQADEAYFIGEDKLSESYLNIEKIISVAKKAKCEAIHPGYGFLSENPDFAEACEKAGIVFIGPDKDIIRKMGNKIEANQFVKSIGVPTIENKIGDKEYLLNEAAKMDFPILLKAAAGGGGKGMRIVRKVEELTDALESTSREALNYFGNDSVYAEKYIENPRHIEVQILGDTNGDVIHLFERECSIQRRYQKIIEEAPSITLNEEVRQKICNAAVEIGKKANYKNAGTIEFLVDKNLNFYFLEMNTRIQVEHPVTEMITGIDIVEKQFRIASGEGLGITQNEIKKKGHAIECRVYAEKPAENFMPSPGKVQFYKAPEMNDIRIESALESDSEVFSFFDPMISKLVVWSENREAAWKKMLNLLDRYIVHGVETNISFLKELTHNQDFINNQISTSYCDKNLENLINSIKAQSENLDLKIPLVGFLLFDLKRKGTKSIRTNKLWSEIGYWRQQMEVPIIIENKEYNILIRDYNSINYRLEIENEIFSSEIIEQHENRILFKLNNKPIELFISFDQKEQASVSFEGKIVKAKRKYILVEDDISLSADVAENENQLISPMPGTVLKINASVGDIVEKGAKLIVIESMKMENNIITGIHARVLKINAKEGELVAAGTVLIELEEVAGS